MRSLRSPRIAARTPPDRPLRRRPPPSTTSTPAGARPASPSSKRPSRPYSGAPSSPSTPTGTGCGCARPIPEAAALHAPPAGPGPNAHHRHGAVRPANAAPTGIRAAASRHPRHPPGAQARTRGPPPMPDRAHTRTMGCRLWYVRISHNIRTFRQMPGPTLAGTHHPGGETCSAITCTRLAPHREAAPPSHAMAAHLPSRRVLARGPHGHSRGASAPCPAARTVRPAMARRPRRTDDAVAHGRPAHATAMRTAAPARRGHATRSPIPWCPRPGTRDDTHGSRRSCPHGHDAPDGPPGP
jgi:hypothetical protein